MEAFILKGVLHFRFEVASAGGYFYCKGCFVKEAGDEHNKVPLQHHNRRWRRETDSEMGSEPAFRIDTRMLSPSGCTR